MWVPAGSSQDGNCRRKLHTNTQGTSLAVLWPEENKCQSGNVSCACDNLTTAADRLPEECLKRKTEEKANSWELLTGQAERKPGREVLCAHGVHEVSSGRKRVRTEQYFSLREKKAKTIDSRE